MNNRIDTARLCQIYSFWFTLQLDDNKTILIGISIVHMWYVCFQVYLIMI